MLNIIPYMKAKMIISLTLICLLSAFLLTGVYQVTNPKIEQDKIKKIKLNLISTMFPEAMEYKVFPHDTSFWTAYDTSGKIINIVRFENIISDTLWAALDTTGNKIGIAFKVFPRGYGGAIETFVALDVDTLILGIRTATPAEGLKETPGLGTKVTEPWFKRQFIGKREADVLLRKDGGSLDAITAATISSRAVTNGVRKGIQKYKKHLIQ